MSAPVAEPVIKLPRPSRTGMMSLETVLAQRRTVRQFTPQPLTWVEVGQLLWAAGGITDPESGKRAAPSAGACYPLEYYAVLGEGLYRYAPAAHALHLVRAQDIRSSLAVAARQEFIGQAPCIIAVCAVLQRTTQRYGQRGRLRYVPMDVGHAAQNLLLQATALGLVGCPVGSFDDQQISAVLGLTEGEIPLYLLPVGKEHKG